MTDKKDKKDNSGFDEIRDELDEKDLEEMQADEESAEGDIIEAKVDDAEFLGENEEENDDTSEYLLMLSPEEIESIIKERDEVKDQLLRMAADYDNYIKRTRREREENREILTSDILSAFLPVIDNFERAMNASDSTHDQLLTGIKMIYQQLLEVMRTFGVEQISADGKKFDPRYHEAMSTEPSSEHEDQTILEEFIKGYFYKDRLLRPAKVKVSVAMDETELAEAKEKLKTESEAKKKQAAADAKKDEKETGKKQAKQSDKEDDEENSGETQRDLDSRD
ncbi:MAG: nucleotide exchange factor GrpE [Acidobacteria bacterium]|nr:nucleotide exchange factor GrpE [Acidobacteriota bacterium]